MTSGNKDDLTFNWVTLFKRMSRRVIIKVNVRDWVFKLNVLIGKSSTLFRISNFLFSSLKQSQSLTFVTV